MSVTPWWCCCDCWRIMDRCAPDPDCPPGEPTLYVPCELLDPLDPPVTYELRGACYQYQGDTSDAPDPALIETTVGVQHPDCLTCCAIPECWIPAEKCFCNVDGPDVFVPCDDVPAEAGSFLYTGECYRIDPATPSVRSLPPGAEEVVPIDLMPSCSDCCPPALCTDCVENPGLCPQTLRINLPAASVSFNGSTCFVPACEVLIGCPSCTCSSGTVCDVVSCSFSQATWSNVALTCESEVPDDGYFGNCVPNPPSICRPSGLAIVSEGVWIVQASISVGGTTIDIVYASDPQSCQPGAYPYHCQNGCSAIVDLLDPGVVTVQEVLP